MPLHTAIVTKVLGRRVGQGIGAARASWVGGGMTGLAHATGTACADDASKGAPEGVNSRFLEGRERFFVGSFCLAPSGLEEHGGAAVELELCRINSGHLEDSNSHTDDEKGQDDGEDLTGAGFEALEKDLKGPNLGVGYR